MKENQFSAVEQQMPGDQSVKIQCTNTCRPAWGKGCLPCTSFGY